MPLRRPAIPWLGRLSALALLSLVASGAQAAGPALVEQSPRAVAPDLALQDLEGHTHRLEAYRGRPVVVNFWATWCPPCMAEMSSMDRAQEVLRDAGVVFLAVNAGEAEEKVREISARTGIRILVLLDPDATEQGRWGLRGMPTTYVLDKEGRIAYRAEGGKLWDSPRLVDPIRALSQEAGVH